MFEPKNVIFAQEWNNSEYHNGIQRPSYSKTDTFRQFSRHSQKIVLSMIRFTKGNLLTANAEALVNTVNTVGVMGKGIALQFKEEFPENFAIYADACKSGE